MRYAVITDLMSTVNERLRLAMVRRGVSPDALAAACAVDPKTVARWLTGRVPHARHRWATAELLAAAEDDIWPSRQRPVASDPHPEPAACFPNRASVPRDLWLSLLQNAEQQIDVLVYSGTFFAQSNPHVATMLAARARVGAAGAGGGWRWRAGPRCAGWRGGRRRSGTTTRTPWRCAVGSHSRAR